MAGRTLAPTKTQTTYSLQQQEVPGDYAEFALVRPALLGVRIHKPSFHSFSKNELPLAVVCLEPPQNSPGNGFYMLCETVLFSRRGGFKRANDAFGRNTSTSVTEFFNLSMTIVSRVRIPRNTGTTRGPAWNNALARHLAHAA